MKREPRNNPIKGQPRKKRQEREKAQAEAAAKAQADAAAKTEADAAAKTEAVQGQPQA
jgi:hypothetical protein